MRAKMPLNSSYGSFLQDRPISANNDQKCTGVYKVKKVNKMGLSESEIKHLEFLKTL